MGSIRQHRPSYFTGFENEVATFNSLEELLKIEFVDNFKKAYNKPLPKGISAGLVDLMDHGQDNAGFHQFSISERNGEKILMAEYRQGKEWWVVGYITDETGLTDSLPKWEPEI